MFCNSTTKVLKFKDHICSKLNKISFIYYQLYLSGMLKEFEITGNYKASWGFEREMGNIENDFKWKRSYVYVGW